MAKEVGLEPTLHPFKAGVPAIGRLLNIMAIKNKSQIQLKLIPTAQLQRLNIF